MAQPSTKVSNSRDGKSTPLRISGEHLIVCHEDQYDNLLEEKKINLLQLLGLPISHPVQVFESPRKHFRMRANFTVWRDNKRDDSAETMYYAMYDPDKPRVPHEVHSFPRGTQLLNYLMHAVQQEWQLSREIRNDLFEVRLVTTQIGQAVIVLLYHREISDVWLAAAEQLRVRIMSADASAVGQPITKVNIIGRSRKVKLIVGEETIEEKYSLPDGRQMVYYQTEGAFSQPNASVCEKMLAWSLEMTRANNSNATEPRKQRDLLELYCGGGTFTAALATNFRKVLATEISKESVVMARRCFETNGLQNVQVARLSSEEFTEALNSLNSTMGPSKFSKRLQDAGIVLNSYDFETVFVDPPRAGLDSATCELLKRFDRILYISCNPETLARDVQRMATTHQLQQLAAFDQFPYTHHLECGALLVKYSASSSNSSGDRDGNSKSQGETSTIAGNKRKLEPEGVTPLDT